jgi:hypothetical protein
MACWNAGVFLVKCCRGIERPGARSTPAPWDKILAIVDAPEAPTIIETTRQ